MSPRPPATCCPSDPPTCWPIEPPRPCAASFASVSAAIPLTSLPTRVPSALAVFGPSNSPPRYDRPPAATPPSSAFWRFLPVARPPAVVPKPVPRAVPRLVATPPADCITGPSNWPPAADRPPMSAPLSGSLPEIAAPAAPASAGVRTDPRTLRPGTNAVAMGSAAPSTSPTTLVHFFAGSSSATRRHWPVAGSSISTPQLAFLPLVADKSCAIA